MQMPNEKIRLNPLSWIVKYLQESREELHKITWPSKKQTIQYSFVVIGISVAVAIFFAALDWVLTLGLEKLIDVSS